MKSLVCLVWFGFLIQVTIPEKNKSTCNQEKQRYQHNLKHTTASEARFDAHGSTCIKQLRTQTGLVFVDFLNEAGKKDREKKRIQGKHLCGGQEFETMDIRGATLGGV